MTRILDNCTRRGHCHTTRMNGADAEACYLATIDSYSQSFRRTFSGDTQSRLAKSSSSQNPFSTFFAEYVSIFRKRYQRMSCKVFKNTSSLLTVTDAKENPAKIYKLVFFRHPSTETLNTFFCEVLTNSHCSVHYRGANKANSHARAFLKRRSAHETADADQSLGETSKDHSKMRHLVLRTVLDLLHPSRI